MNIQNGKSIRIFFSLINIDVFLQLDWQCIVKPLSICKSRLYQLFANDRFLKNIGKYGRRRWWGPNIGNGPVRMPLVSTFVTRHSNFTLAQCPPARKHEWSPANITWTVKAVPCHGWVSMLGYHHFHKWWHIEELDPPLPAFNHEQSLEINLQWAIAPPSFPKSI